MEFPAVMTITLLVGMLLLLVGNALLGAAVWRSGSPPRWAGGLWVTAFVVFIVLGAALGMATTGASLPTQPIGAGLMAISGAGLAWAASRQPARDAVVAEPQPHPV